MDITGRLQSLVAEHGVPGATAAVRIGDEVLTGHAGVVNTATGVETTPDALFQVGSITKTFTATLALTLADTEVCRDLQQSTPLGATWSYCNSGFALLGRVIEVLTGTSGLMKPSSLTEMLRPDVPTPGAAGVRGWGLGWATWDWNGARAVGHDGGTTGQSALLRVLPEHDVAVAVLVCSRDGAKAVIDGVLQLVTDAVGVTPPAPLEPVGDAVPATDLAEQLGVYERTHFRLTLYEDSGRVAGRVELGGPLAETVGTASLDVTVRPGPSGEVLAAMPGIDGWLPLVLYRGQDGGEDATFGPALRRVA